MVIAPRKLPTDDKGTCFGSLLLLFSRLEDPGRVCHIFEEIIRTHQNTKHIEDHVHVKAQGYTVLRSRTKETITVSEGNRARTSPVRLPCGDCDVFALTAKILHLYYPFPSEAQSQYIPPTMPSVTLNGNECPPLTELKKPALASQMDERYYYVRP